MAKTGSKGSKDKGEKVQRKKAQHSLKEKRKLKKDKGKSSTISPV